MNNDNNAGEDDESGESVLRNTAIEEEGSGSNKRTPSTLRASPFQENGDHQWGEPVCQLGPTFRYGSYDTKFGEYLLATGYRVILGNGRYNAGGGCLLGRELFQKELTPSDVGKLNRLVIPKKYAVRYFPPILRPGNNGGEMEGMMLEFKDSHGRVWDFRYCYWKSSHSFVFTKGWNKFVKTNELTTHDTVLFYRCEECGGGGGEGRLMGNIATRAYYFMIDVKRTSQEDGDGVFRQVPESAVEIGPLELRDSAVSDNDPRVAAAAVEGGGGGGHADEDKEVMNGFKLFGVRIVPINK